MSKLWLLFCLAIGPLLTRGAPKTHAQDPKAMNYIDAHVHVWTPDTAPPIHWHPASARRT